MKLLKPSRNVGRNAFDLSHRHLMTTNFGELDPITCIEVVPGDYIEMRVSDLLRAMPMVTSPFMRAKQHIDVWFTSYDDLWHNFEQFITQKDQPVSSALKGSRYCPHTTLNTLFATARKLSVSDLVSPNGNQLTSDVVGRSYSTGALKLLDMLGYGENYLQALDTDGNDVSPKVNIWRLLQYNKIWYDEYRQKYYDTGLRGLSDDFNPAYLFNVDDLPCDSVAHADLMYTMQGNSTYNIDRLSAMLQMRYRTWKKDLFTGALPNTQFGNVSTLPVLDGILIQNRVEGNTDINGGDSDESTFGLYTKTLKDSNRWKANNSVFTTPGDVVINSENGSNLSWSIGDYNGAIDHDHTINVRSGISVSSNVLSTGGLDVLALRKAEALQIWRENALRAGNRISDNLRAHYGDDAEYNDHRSTLLGSISAPLNIQDINAVAQTGQGANQQLADVAGKGLSSTYEP